MGKQPRVAIIGGGISGLATAYYLQKGTQERGLQAEIHLIERSNSLGGVIRTDKENGFLLERGPDNVIPTLRMLEFVSELELSDELIGSNDRLRRTFIARQERLHPLPEGMGLLGPIRLRALWTTSLISLRGKLRACLEPFVPRSRGDLSVYSFASRRLGRELTEALVEPLVGAIYAGDIRKLSIKSTLSEIYRLEQHYGSLWRGMSRMRHDSSSSSSRPLFMSFRSGMSRLVSALAARLSGVSVYRGVEGVRVSSRSEGYQVSGDNFDGLFNALVVSAPAFAAAEVIREVSSPAAGLLSEIPYRSSTIVYLAYQKSEFSHPLDGFGFVVPGNEAAEVDACSWVTSKFEGRAPEDVVLLRCITNRRRREATSREEVVERAHREVQRFLRVSCQPIFSDVHETGASVPQAIVGHSRRLKEIDHSLAAHSGLFLAGAFYRGTGVPACIEGGYQTAQEVLNFLAR